MGKRNGTVVSKQVLATSESRLRTHPPPPPYCFCFNISPLSSGPLDPTPQPPELWQYIAQLGPDFKSYHTNPLIPINQAEPHRTEPPKPQETQYISIINSETTLPKTITFTLIPIQHCTALALYYKYFHYPHQYTPHHQKFHTSTTHSELGT